MPPKASYADRVFTTAVVSYPELKHIGADKDFTPVIEKALELGGYAEDKAFTGINGGSTVTTGFARGAVLGVADKVVEAVNSGRIRHFFLSRRLRRRAPRQELLHGIRQADTARHHGADAGLRQVPLQ